MRMQSLRVKMAQIQEGFIWIMVIKCEVEQFWAHLSS